MAPSPKCLECPGHAGRTGIENLRWLPVGVLVPLVYDGPEPVETERRIDVGDDRRNRAFDVRSSPWLVNKTVELVRLVKHGFLLVHPAIRCRRHLAARFPPRCARPGTRSSDQLSRKRHVRESSERPQAKTCRGSPLGNHLEPSPCAAALFGQLIAPGAISITPAAVRRHNRWGHS